MFHEFQQFHQGVHWDKWNFSAYRNSVECVFREDPHRRAIFNFGKRRQVVVYQLIYNKKNITTVAEYDHTTLASILNEWENGEVFVKLRV